MKLPSRKSELGDGTIRPSASGQSADFGGTPVPRPGFLFPTNKQPVLVVSAFGRFGNSRITFSHPDFCCLMNSLVSMGFATPSGTRCELVREGGKL